MKIMKLFKLFYKKKWLFLDTFFRVILSILIISFMEVVRTYYAKGQLKEEYCLINNKKEGLYKLYYSDGQLHLICNYIDGKRNGEWQLYYNNGQIWGNSNYVNGKING